MSLNLYCDQALTLQATQLSPKRFLVPAKGGTKASVVWLGDPYTSKCSIQANSGASVLNLADTGEFYSASDIAEMSSGHATAISGSQTFTYTGKTQGTLTGVSGITSTISVNDIVYPSVVYHCVGGTNLEAFPIGSDYISYRLALAVSPTPTLGFPGLPGIFPEKSIAIGVNNAIAVYVGLTVPAGADQEFTNFGVQVSNLYKRDASDTTAYGTTEGAYAPEAKMYAYRHDQGLPIPIRVLPINRKVSTDLPGFIIGQYKWRGDANRNATALVPTSWDQDPNIIGLGNYVAGIGDLNDLEPVQLVQEDNSVRMQVERGEYFTGSNRYYLPSNPVLEFIPCSESSMDSDGSISFQLQKTPRQDGAPIFIGTYVLDNQQYYEKTIEYKYQATLLNSDGTFRDDLPEYYFTLDRTNNTVTLNQPLSYVIMFLGAVSGLAQDYFNMPVYPVDDIQLLYVDRGANASKLYAIAWTFDREDGTIIVPNIDGSLADQPLFAIGAPAVAVLYDTGPDETFQVETVDFNPAFSGLASGYFYLQHRIQAATSLVLSCDKPLIPIPATQASIIGLIAYGPVYYTNDYALLSVTAYGPLNGETIPNAVLNVIVDPETFTGTINYQDPLTEQITVITGGDGTANLIFIPKNGFGIYIPTTAAVGSNGDWLLAGLATTNTAGDTLILPVPGVPLSQLWNPQEGWLVTTYTIVNNDPLFGMVGADPSLGQIPWITTGTPGTGTYKTNGEIDAWRTGNVSVGTLILPIDALDINGHSYTNSLFNGTVQQLVYASAIPQVSTIGAYFITFIQRVLIRMQLENSNVYSNSILIQMSQPNLIVDNPWLILNDSIQGLINQYRLGYVKP